MKSLSPSSNTINKALVCAEGDLVLYDLTKLLANVQEVHVWGRELRLVLKDGTTLDLMCTEDVVALCIEKVGDPEKCRNTCALVV